MEHPPTCGLEARRAIGFVLQEHGNAASRPGELGSGNNFAFRARQLKSCFRQSLAALGNFAAEITDFRGHQLPAGWRVDRSLLPVSASAAGSKIGPYSSSAKTERTHEFKADRGTATDYQAAEIPAKLFSTRPVHDGRNRRTSEAAQRRFAKSRACKAAASMPPSARSNGLPSE